MAAGEVGGVMKLYLYAQVRGKSAQMEKERGRREGREKGDRIANEGRIVKLVCFDIAT